MEEYRRQGQFGPNSKSDKLLEYLSGGDLDRIRHTVGRMEKFLQKVPFINAFGQHLLIVVQKRCRNCN